MRERERVLPLPLFVLLPSSLPPPPSLFLFHPLSHYLISQESFRSVQAWATEIDRYADDAHLLLVGNKTDLVDKRCVSKAAAEVCMISDVL